MDIRPKWKFWWRDIKRDKPINSSVSFAHEQAFIHLLTFSIVVLYFLYQVNHNFIYMYI